jgi:hypothetical protein
MALMGRIERAAEQPDARPPEAADPCRLDPAGIG